MVTLLAGVGLYYTLKMVDESSTSGDLYRVWALFPDASGLVERSRVTMAGIPVGYIDEIELMTYFDDAGAADAGAAERKRMVGARVTVAVEGDVPLYRDAKANKMVGSVVTGDYLIVLSPGDPETGRVEDGDRIEAEVSGLFDQVDTIAGDIEQVTGNLRRVFGSEEGGRQMGEVLANLKDISVSINELLEQNQETVNRTLENIDGITASARPGLEQIVNDMREITSALREFVEQNQEQAGEAVTTAGETLEEIRVAVSKLDRVLDDVGDVSQGVAEGEGTVGRLLKDDKLIDDVENVVDDVGGFVHRITALKTIVGLAGEFNFYENSMKTILQLRLQPREDKYYLIEAIYDPRGATARRETVVQSTNPDEPAQYREVRYVTRDSLLFSLMFARRLRFATFRFGIKESSGGLGLDIHLLRDRVELSTDLYRFGEDVYPRLKGMAAIEFLRHLYIVGGINDSLNESRDYFIGMMVRFNDEDLKSILAFSPSVPSG
ncbi:MAG: MlaD family protein [Polyangia bacterium]